MTAFASILWRAAVRAALSLAISARSAFCNAETIALSTLGKTCQWAAHVRPTEGGERAELN
eukprot:scaffold4033_cov60-Phaeocystis_antarctica.AAC.1